MSKGFLSIFHTTKTMDMFYILRQQGMKHYNAIFEERNGTHKRDIKIETLGIRTVKETEREREKERERESKRDGRES